MLTNKILRVKELLADGMDADLQDIDGLTPLHYAAGEGYMEILRLLVEADANVAVRDNEGDMPVHVAVQENQIEVRVLCV